MKLERYKSSESEVIGALVSTLVGKVIFESDDPLFEDPNMHGNEEFVRAVINNRFDNESEPMSTVTIIRGSVHDTYRLWFDGGSIKVSDADKLRDTALVSVMPWVSTWFDELVATAIEVAMSESQSLADSISESESISLSLSTSESESVSLSEEISLSEWLSESTSLSESLSESLSTSESLSVSTSVSESESLVISEVYNSYETSLSLVSEGGASHYRAISQGIETAVQSMFDSLSALSESLDVSYASQSELGSEYAESLIDARLSGSEESEVATYVVYSEVATANSGISHTGETEPELISEAVLGNVTDIKPAYVEVTPPLSEAPVVDEVEVQAVGSERTENTADLLSSSEISVESIYTSLSLSLEARVSSEYTATLGSEVSVSSVSTPTSHRKKRRGIFGWFKSSEDTSEVENTSLTASETIYSVSPEQVTSEDDGWEDASEVVRTHVSFRSEAPTFSEVVKDDVKKRKQFTVGDDENKVRVTFDE